MRGWWSTGRFYHPKTDGDCCCPMRGVDPERAPVDACFHEFRETEKRGGEYVLVCLTCDGRLPEGSDPERALRAKGIDEDTIRKICGPRRSSRPSENVAKLGGDVLGNIRREVK